MHYSNNTWKISYRSYRINNLHGIKRHTTVVCGVRPPLGTDMLVRGRSPTRDGDQGRHCLSCFTKACCVLSTVPLFDNDQNPTLVCICVLLEIHAQSRAPAACRCRLLHALQFLLWLWCVCLLMLSLIFNLISITIKTCLAFTLLHVQLIYNQLQRN